MLDKESNLPFYMQFKNIILERINSGAWKAGNPLPTEQQLCVEFGISRYPVRQAMEELVTEGYLNRTRGRGTFVSEKLPKDVQSSDRKLLGLVLGYLGGDLCTSIIIGFEKQARKKGYGTIICSSDGMIQEELNCIDRLLEWGSPGICIFPINESRIAERVNEIKSRGVYIGLIDRKNDVEDLDYTGSDNIGGAYTAVRHLAEQGYRNVVFISDKSNVSSVDERLEGYLRAVEDFGLNSLTPININEDLSKYPNSKYRFFVDSLREELSELKIHFPLGILGMNDYVSISCMKILLEENFQIGGEVGLVSFDNNVQCEFAPVPLTSVSQNGLLIGQTAADSAIEKIEGKSNLVYRSSIPTQLIVRESCGERK